MGLDQSTLGILSPFVAVVGDLALALLSRSGWWCPAVCSRGGVSRGLERRAWAWCLGDRGLGWARAARPELAGAPAPVRGAPPRGALLDCRRR